MRHTGDGILKFSAKKQNIFQFTEQNRHMLRGRNTLIINDNSQFLHVTICYQRGMKADD